MRFLGWVVRAASLLLEESERRYSSNFSNASSGGAEERREEEAAEPLEHGEELDWDSDDSCLSICRVCSDGEEDGDGSLGGRGGALCPSWKRAAAGGSCSGLQLRGAGTGGRRLGLAL